MSSWIKAGLIGALVVAVLNVMGLIPCVGIFTCILTLVVYPAIGALAAYWLPPLRQAGQAAGQGAMAATLAALIGGLVNTIIFTIQVAATDTATVLSQMPAESLQQLRDAGIDPASLTGPVAGLGVGSACCLVGLALAALLGAVGGAILAAAKPD
jgi:hypothetical protein